jgi:hypothetical protein
VLRAYKIPPTALFGIVVCLMVGEWLCGTGTYFVGMMAVMMFCGGVTYNILGGMGTFSGIVFAANAVRWVVLSQFAKVFLRQPADYPLDVPDVTITIYALFFFCNMVGAFMFSRFRLRLPKPWEPETTSQSSILYVIAVVSGTVGMILFQINNGAYGDAYTQQNASHSIGLALNGFLLFSLILAIDQRIRTSNGRHSFSWQVFIPWCVATIAGFQGSTRGNTAAPTVAYALACYLRGYRFRLRHYIVLAGIGAFCVVALFPLEVYSRQFISNKSFTDRLQTSFRLLLQADWTQIRSFSTVGAGTTGESPEDYYDVPGDQVLSRNSLIRADSNLIRGTVSYHYGFTGLKLDLLAGLPHFIYSNKGKTSQYGGADVTDQLSGIGVDQAAPAISFTMIADSFGMFGWLGVVVVGLMVYPLMLTLYDSIFDITRPWGIVALATTVLAANEGGVDRLVAQILMRNIAYFLLASYAVGFVTRMIPVRGDSPSSRLVPAEAEAP